MPIFEFKCTECASVSEEITSNRELQVSECPVCGGVSKKIMSAAGWDIKGGGVYRTNAPDTVKDEPKFGRRRVKIG